MGWKDALIGANSRQPSGVFAAYGHLQEVALNAHNQTVEGYRLLRLHGSHPWLGDDQTQAYFHSAWMLDSFVKVAQASIEEVTVKGTVSDEAVALARVFYDQASAWAGYWQFVPNAPRSQVRIQQPQGFQLVQPQVTSFETLRMAIAAAEALHSSTVESVVDLGAQENLPLEWRRHLGVLQSRIHHVGSDVANITPFKTSLQRGGILPPHLAPLVIQIIGVLLGFGRQLNYPMTLDAALTGKTPVNIFDLETQPAAAQGKPITRYASLDHAGLASTARSLGFDVWRLVAPEQRQRRSSRRDDVRAFDRLMAQADPRTDGPAIKRIVDEIDEATVPNTGTITRSPGEALLSAPWSPVYMATATVILGGERFGQGEKFAYTMKASSEKFIHTFERLGFDPAHTPARPVRRLAQADLQPTAAVTTTRPAPDPLWRYSAPVAWRLWHTHETRVKLLTELIDTVRESPLWEQLQVFQTEIEAALRDAKIEHRQEEYQEKACPWAPVYVAREPITLAGKNWRAGDAFFLLISAGEGRLTITGQGDGQRRLHSP